MKIWLEALTGKQALLSHYLAVFLEEEGHETLVTSREYDYASKNLERLGRPHYSIGKYGGSSLKNKLVVGAERIIQLADLIDTEHPDLLISFPSPDAHRTAFGLNIPIIQLNDTPHAHAVAKLTISLANELVHPKSVKEEEFKRHGTTHMISYDGVDEALWIKNFTPNPILLEKYDLLPNNYLVIRCEESKAAYFRELYPQIEPGSTIVKEIVSELRENNINLKVIAFPRYPEQESILQEFDNVIIPEKSIDTLSLLHFAKATMTGGGTMGREAAMLGTPTIYTFPDELAVSTVISQRGFPLFHHPNHVTAPQRIISLLNTPRMDETKRVSSLQSLETPIDGVVKAMAKLQLEGLI